MALTTTSTLAKAVKVTNCSTTAATLTNARLEGPDASAFSIVLPPSVSALAPDDTVEWFVVASPRSAGPKQAVFSVDHDGTPVSVTLVVEAVEPPEIIDGEVRPSYYACGTGRANAGWPLAVACGLALRRRRRRRA